MAKLRILLVEDDDDLRFIFSNKLLEEGQALTVVSSGNEAIKLLDSSQAFDLIVSDYSMADGNGLKLLKYVSQKQLNIRFVFFTNTVDPEVPPLSTYFLGVIDKHYFDQLLEIIHGLKLNGF